MNYFYMDASALGKRYVAEIGTNLVNRLFDSVPRARMICLVLGLGEVVSILVRRRNAGAIPVHAYKQALVEFRMSLIRPTSRFSRCRMTSSGFSAPDRAALIECDGCSGLALCMRREGIAPGASGELP